MELSGILPRDVIGLVQKMRREIRYAPFPSQGNLFSEILSLSVVSAKIPDITTSIGNQRDLYLAWEDLYDYDDNDFNENVVAIKELYP